MNSSKKCLICEKPLLMHLVHQGVFFCNPQCRWKHEHLPESQRCRVCRCALSKDQLQFRFCSDPACRQAYSKEMRAKEQARVEEAKRIRKAQFKLALKLRDESASAVGIGEPSSYPLGVVPTYSEPITELPESRREEMRQHIAYLIELAAVNPSVPSEDGEPTTQVPESLSSPAILGQACARCTGYCCRNGGVHAYLTEDTLRQYLNSHPELRPEEVLEEYISRIGTQTYLNSCVFHGIRGCTLPREMRSETCNTYLCEGLKEFKTQLGGASTTRAFFASEGSGDSIRAAAFIDDNGVTEVPVSNESQG